jgi:hypothetical protein
MIFAKMTTRQRLLALLEIYDTAIEELYVLGDRGLVALILRLERRRMEAHRGLLSLRGIRRPVCGGTQMGRGFRTDPHSRRSRVFPPDGPPQGRDTADAGGSRPA